jgi:hypothetical protein
MRVRSVITEPAQGADVDAGALAVRGLAWSGAAPIDGVVVSVNGEAWQAAKMLGEPSMHCWQRWELETRIGSPGRITLRSRASDRAGATQPDHPEWNRLGYGNNAIREVSVNARAAGTASPRS